MGRITIDGRRVQFSTRLSVPPGLWETVAGKAGGRSAAANRINDRLAHIRFRMEQCYESVFAERKYVTPQAVKAVFRYGPRLHESAGIFPPAQRRIRTNGGHLTFQKFLL